MKSINDNTLTITMLVCHLRKSAQIIWETMTRFNGGEHLKLRKSHASNTRAEERFVRDVCERVVEDEEAGWTSSRMAQPKCMILTYFLESENCPPLTFTILHQCKIQRLIFSTGLSFEFLLQVT